jgi:5-methylcytosine-specific restriction protein A
MSHIILHLILRERILLDPYFSLEDHTKAEKRKARELRHSRWWKNKIHSSALCHYCQKVMEPQEVTMDHLLPISRGGKSTKNNVVPCCKPCNTAKRDQMATDWEGYL